MSTWLETHLVTLLLTAAIATGFAVAMWFVFFYEARITIIPDPVTATVTVDGEVKTGKSTFKLKPGEHRLSVALDDFIPLTQTIKSKSGQYTKLNLELRRVPHLEYISTQASGAIVEDTQTTKDTSEVTREENFRYLNRVENRIERFTLDSSRKPKNPQILTPSKFTNIDSWLWGPNKDLALFKQADRWRLYDFARYDLINQEIIDWSENIGSVSWSPVQSTLIHYNTSKEGEKTLVQANPRHTAIDRLIDLRESGITDPIIRWVGAGDDVILLSRDGRLWRFIVYTRTLTPITQSETVSDFVASPNGQMILARQADGRIFTIEIDGKNKQTVNGTESLRQVVWSPDSSALWILGEENESYSLRRVELSIPQVIAQYSIAKGETVGEIDSMIITEDEKKLILAGTRGVAVVRVEKSEY